MTNYRNGPQRTATEKDWCTMWCATAETAKEPEWAAGTARETDWSTRDWHEMQGKCS